MKDFFFKKDKYAHTRKKERSSIKKKKIYEGYLVVYLNFYIYKYIYIYMIIHQHISIYS